MVAGREVSPKDAENTARIKGYWSHGPGAAKIRWNTDGDFDRCLVQLGKHVTNPEELKGLCANLHHDATGAWPGHAPGESKPRARKA